ncbi:MAG TPA: hypothetical protein VF329_08050 [Gammaproteobacteria bacterium]
MRTRGNELSPTDDMKRTPRPPAPGDDDPAGAKPTGDPQADERIRFVVSARDNPMGTIGVDDLGQPRWTWITELEESTGDERTEDTFDYLKALDNTALTVADEPGATGRDRRRASKENGYDPYDTSRIKIKGKFPGR